MNKFLSVTVTLLVVMVIGSYCVRLVPVVDCGGCVEVLGVMETNSTKDS
jgi:hypothetical protein